MKRSQPSQLHQPYGYVRGRDDPFRGDVPPWRRGRKPQWQHTYIDRPDSNETSGDANIGDETDDVGQDCSQAAQGGWRPGLSSVPRGSVGSCFQQAGAAACHQADAGDDDEAEKMEP